jgi:glycosyltransferase involved in cell wall biosynthesis
MKITGCILAKDEENTIGACITNLTTVADEIVVIDNGSSDNTIEVAEKMGCVVRSCVNETFDRARNAYHDVATGDWILSLDVDERIDPSSIDYLKDVLERSKDYMAFRLPRYDYIGNGKWALIDLCRLYKNDPQIGYDNLSMHASIAPALRKINGKAKSIEFALHHYDAFFEQERLYAKRVRNIANTLAELEELPKDSKYVYFLRSFLGLEYAALGRFDDAENEYREAMKFERNYKNYAQLYLAQNYRLMGEYDRAKAEALKLVETDDPLMLRAMIIIADIDLYEGRREQAYLSIKKIYEKENRLAANLINMVEFLYQESPTEATQFISEAIKINPLLLSADIYREGGGYSTFKQQSSFLRNTKTIFYYLGEMAKGGCEDAKRVQERVNDYKAVNW